MFDDMGDYLADAWYMAGWDTDFGQSPVAVMLLGRPIVLYRLESGNVAALEDRCSHRNAALSLGRCEGDNLRCMYHGLLFNNSGTCIEVPGQDRIPASLSIATYPVIERHSAVWIWMGEPALADQALVPEFVGYRHPDWSMRPGEMIIEAPARLIHDNLLDLSHLGYVHVNSFLDGNAEATKGWLYGETKVETGERGVRVTRRMPSVPPSRAGGKLALNELSYGDAYSYYDFVAPGVFIQFVGRYPLGSYPSIDTIPREMPLFSNFTCQAVVPIAPGRARYFFAFGPDSRFPEQRDLFYDMATEAFAEDKRMIESQYRTMQSTGNWKPMPLSMDEALTKYSGVLNRISKHKVMPVS